MFIPITFASCPVAFDSTTKTFLELLIKLTISFDPINHNKTSYLVLQSHILNGLGKYDEAVKTIDNAIDLVPTLNSLYARKSYLLITSQRESEALNLIDELLENHPSLKQSLLKQKSYVQVALKQYEEGLKTVDEGIELDPNDIAFINNKAMILGYLGRREEAIETAEYLIRLNPRNGNSYDTYGEVLMVLGEYENAIEKLKEALNLEPTGWFAFATCLKMVECFKELGKFEKAIEYYEKGKKLTEKMHPSERETYKEKYLPKAEKMISEIRALLGDSNINE